MRQRVLPIELLLVGKRLRKASLHVGLKLLIRLLVAVDDVRSAGHGRLHALGGGVGALRGFSGVLPALFMLTEDAIRHDLVLLLLELLSQLTLASARTKAIFLLLLQRARPLRIVDDFAEELPASREKQGHISFDVLLRCFTILIF